MNKFLKRTVSFIIMTACLLVSVIFIPNYVVDKKSKFTIQQHRKMVLFGHSHPECAFNDTLITNFQNLAYSAEPYFYTYQKIKKVLSQNPHIETVLIEFSNNQIDEKMNDWTWGYKYMSSMFPKYASFMDREDINLLIKNNPKDFMSCMSISTRKNLVRVLTGNYNFSDEMGGYLRIGKLYDNGKTANDAKDKVSAKFSDVNVSYLKKIVNYSRARNKKVFLVRSPHHKKYEYLKNETAFVKIRNTEFADVDFLDFNNFPLHDDDFADYGHLNYKGADKFSKWFNTMVDSGLLQDENIQALIDQNLSPTSM